jgi:hypothetical protein
MKYMAHSMNSTTVVGRKRKNFMCYLQFLIVFADNAMIRDSSGQF